MAIFLSIFLSGLPVAPFLQPFPGIFLPFAYEYTRKIVIRYMENAKAPIIVAITKGRTELKCTRPSILGKYHTRQAAGWQDASRAGVDVFLAMRPTDTTSYLLPERRQLSSLLNLLCLMWRMLEMVERAAALTSCSFTASPGSETREKTVSMRRKRIFTNK